MPVDESIIGGDPDSFVSRSFYNTSSMAPAVDREQLGSQVSMEMKLLEAQSRIRSLRVEAQRKTESDADVARERVRAAQAERAREEERGRAAQWETLNRSLADELEAEKSKSARKPAAVPADVKALKEALAARDKQVARLEAQLLSAGAVAEHSRQALQNVVDLQQHQGRGESGAADAHVLRVELESKSHELAMVRARLKAQEDVRSENERLRSRVSELELAAARRGVQEESDKNSLRLQEENASLKQKLVRMQNVARDLASCQAELEQANLTLAQWKVVISGEYPSLEHVQDAMGQLRAQINTLKVENSTLLTSNRAMEGRIRQHDAQVATLTKGRELLEEQCAQLKAAHARSESEVTLLKESVKANQFVLEAFNKEGSNFGNYDAPKSQRIAQLEEELRSQAEFVKQLQEECRKLDGSLEAARERMFALESRLTAGEFNPETVQVLHLRMNPMVAEGDEKEHKLAQLAGENEYLKQRLAAAKQAGTTTAEMESLKKDNVTLAKRLERLKQIAQAKISEFREIVVLLFGYRVDVEFDTHIYTLAPIGDSSKKLKFKGADKGLQLLESEYALQLPASVTQYLEQYDSIPGFLAAITLSGIE